MTRSSSLTLVMTAVFTLSYGFAAADETANGPQAQTPAPTDAKNPTKSEKKEETANKRPAENDAAKRAEEPNCE